MICRPSYHHVKQHFRKTRDGSRYKVEEHCRKNPKSKEKLLFKSNLDFIFEKNRERFEYKNLQRIKGYSQDRGQYDEYIQFWLQYWQSKGLIGESVDPLLVKAIIAVESSFREAVITAMPNSSATGLMQILKTTMRILAGKLGREVRKFNIEITQEEAREANVNIAAGTRWLIYKITTSPWRNKKRRRDRMYGGVKYYHSWDENGESYAEKVFRIYNESK